MNRTTNSTEGYSRWTTCFHFAHKWLWKDFSWILGRVAALHALNCSYMARLAVKKIWIVCFNVIDRRFVQTPSKFWKDLLFINACNWHFTGWLCEINPRGLGNVPPDVPGYPKVLKFQAPSYWCHSNPPLSKNSEIQLITLVLASTLSNSFFFIFTIHETTASTWQLLQMLTFQINRCNAAWAKTAQTAAGLGPDQRGFSSAAWSQIRTDDVISPRRGHTLDYVQTCLVLSRYIEQQVIWGHVAVLRLILCFAGTPMLGLQVYSF